MILSWSPWKLTGFLWRKTYVCLQIFLIRRLIKELKYTNVKHKECCEIRHVLRHAICESHQDRDRRLATYIASTIQMLLDTAACLHYLLNTAMSTTHVRVMSDALQPPSTAVFQHCSTIWFQCWKQIVHSRSYQGFRFDESFWGSDSWLVVTSLDSWSTSRHEEQQQASSQGRRGGAATGSSWWGANIFFVNHISD